MVRSTPYSNPLVVDSRNALMLRSKWRSTVSYGVTYGVTYGVWDRPLRLLTFMR
jgi:hypothetical protein